jgi:hypothetical protein
MIASTFLFLFFSWKKTIYNASVMKSRFFFSQLGSSNLKVLLPSSLIKVFFVSNGKCFMKIIFFFNFSVFGMTENCSQTKNILLLTKTFFNFSKMVSFFFLKKKTVNDFSILSFSFFHTISRSSLFTTAVVWQNMLSATVEVLQNSIVAGHQSSH